MCELCLGFIACMNLINWSEVAFCLPHRCINAVLWLCEKKNIFFFLTKDPRRKALGVSIIDPWRTVCCWLGRGPFSLTILYKYIGWGQLKSFDLSNSSTERYIPKRKIIFKMNKLLVSGRYTVLNFDYLKQSGLVCLFFIMCFWYEKWKWFVNIIVSQSVLYD